MNVIKGLALLGIGAYVGTRIYVCTLVEGLSNPDHNEKRAEICKKYIKNIYDFKPSFYFDIFSEIVDEQRLKHSVMEVIKESTQD